MTIITKTILCPIALAERDDEVLTWALSEAQLRDARIVLVHAVEPLNPTAKMLLDSLQDDRISKVQEKVIPDAVQLAKKGVEHFCTEHMCLDLSGDPRIAEIVVVRGRPEQVIVEEARRWEADLIVMGSHSHTRLGEAILGSVAHSVVRKAGVPVLLVKYSG